MIPVPLPRNESKEQKNFPKKQSSAKIYRVRLIIYTYTEIRRHHPNQSNLQTPAAVRTCTLQLTPSTSLPRLGPERLARLQYSLYGSILEIHSSSNNTISPPVRRINFIQGKREEDYERRQGKSEIET